MGRHAAGEGFLRGFVRHSEVDTLYCFAANRAAAQTFARLCEQYALGAMAVPLAHRVGPTGRVIAFEPQRVAHACLSANIVMNGLTWAHAERRAVAAAPREVRVIQASLDSPRNLGRSPLIETAEGDAVQCVTLDDLRLAPVAVVKIDVEGMELDVLKGASFMLEKQRPIVYLEAKRGESTRAALTFMRSFGYSLYRHFAYFYSAGNFRGNHQNVFPDIGDANVLAVPGERGIEPKLPTSGGRQ
jgi:FkbM family methyltransferase